MRRSLIPTGTGRAAVQHQIAIRNCLAIRIGERALLCGRVRVTVFRHADINVDVRRLVAVDAPSETECSRCRLAEREVGRVAED